jgi:hypothetical protein
MILSTCLRIPSSCMMQFWSAFRERQIRMIAKMVYWIVIFALLSRS